MCVTENISGAERRPQRHERVKSIKAYKGFGIGYLCAGKFDIILIMVLKVQ